jgi:outer membrane protein assembly factor BamA
VNYILPALAWVYDNSLFGYTGPFYGRRSRIEFAQSIGDWNFSQITFDYRRYDKIAGPVILASRLLYFGRIGRDADRFRIFVGSTDLIRGNTSGSYRRNECLSTPGDANNQGSCSQLDALVGTQLGVASAEIRFPILTPALGFVPQGFPPIEGVLFYDIGMAWDKTSVLRWQRTPGDNSSQVRTPLKTIGIGARMNLFGFAVARLDYAIPQDRRGVKGLWTLSLGPAF